MAQYLAITGSSFGHGHLDNPTYTITANEGTVLLSGSGGYVNAATAITKAALTSGIKVKLSSDSATSVTATVNSGFNCDSETAQGTWTLPTPTSTPTGTPTPTPSAQLRTILLTDSEPDSTINGSAAGLSIGSSQRNYTQDDVNAGSNQNLVGPVLISYNAGEEFTISTVNLDDGAGGSYTHTLSDYVPGAGYYLSITGSFPDTAGGTTTTVDLTITGTAEATYEHELRYNINSISNAQIDFDSTASTAALTETANTQSFAGIEDRYYTASFKFEANNNYAWNGFNDVTVALSDGSPATGISKVYQRFSGSGNEVIEIGYAGDIGANDAFADLTFSGTPEFALYITNADDITVRYRVPGGSGTYYDLIVSSSVQDPVTAASHAAGATIDLRPTTHDGKYEIVNNNSLSWITSISPQENTTLDDLTHTVTLAENTNPSDRYGTIQLRPSDGELGVKLNIPISQSGTA